jgi:hypothetical protein
MDIENATIINLLSQAYSKLINVAEKEPEDAANEILKIISVYLKDSSTVLFQNQNLNQNESLIKSSEQ